MRFVRAGLNWEGRKWTVTAGLGSLLDQVEAVWPEPSPSDGTVASKAHDAANPTSDHRPTPHTGPGVVHAADVGEVTEDDGIVLAEALRLSRDPRIKYVIHEDRIFSSTVMPFRWRPYTGPNRHSNHVHVSVLPGSEAGPWDLGEHMEHTHQPMPQDLPRAWADGTWEEWVARSGTLNATRGDTFYREDLGWVYARVIKPLEQKVVALEAAVSTLQAEVARLQAGSGITQLEADKRYVVRGNPYRIG